MALVGINTFDKCEIKLNDEDDVFIKFGLKILNKPNGYALFTDYYKKINSIDNELTKILYDITLAINSKDDTELAKQFLELTLLKQDICSYICRFKVNTDDIDDYFNKIKYDNIVPDPDQIVCDLKEEWFIRLEKLSKIYEREKDIHDIKTTTSLSNSLFSSIKKMLSSSQTPKRTIDFKPLDKLENKYITSNLSETQNRDFYSILIKPNTCNNKYNNNKYYKDCFTSNLIPYDPNMLIDKVVSI